ncbi:uncharacterized protein LOC131605437 [Vicia villosa]|uniref:uncharacterized protein LOC131605437 n=1 Tax=Vicia villosa TaxID=3911 RepID=UPI00273BCBAB|nr:uncharacterized protein LOC131605437 [Vicia villosa]
MAKDCRTPKAELAVNAARTVWPTSQGRVYCMGAEGRSPSNNLIQGNCEIEGTILTTLFDSGATHSFISKDCVDRLKMKLTPLPFDLVVSTPAKVITVNTACLLCRVVVQEREFLVNLICLPLQSLEIILGMYWMSYHYVMLDCARKLVILPEPGVFKYLSANQLKASRNSGALDLSILASTEVMAEVKIEKILVA